MGTEYGPTECPVEPIRPNASRICLSFSSSVAKSSTNSAAYARRGGLRAAVDGARRRRGLADALGAPGKYHETMTVGWARLVGSRVVASEPLPFPAFLGAHPELLRRDLLGVYYSHELLASERARAAFVEPDVTPLV